jgi:hypothetical protein
MRRAIKLGGCCAVVLNLAPAFAQEKETTPPADTASINEIVTKCLDIVHSYKGDVSTEYFSKRFDAFYNPLTHQVENNARIAPEQEPLFRFNKCMAQQGVPLSYSSKGRQ